MSERERYNLPTSWVRAVLESSHDLSQLIRQQEGCPLRFAVLRRLGDRLVPSFEVECRVDGECLIVLVRDGDGRVVARGQARAEPDAPAPL